MIFQPDVYDGQSWTDVYRAVMFDPDVIHGHRPRVLEKRIDNELRRQCGVKVTGSIRQPGANWMMGSTDMWYTTIEMTDATAQDLFQRPLERENIVGAMFELETIEWEGTVKVLRFTTFNRGATVVVKLWVRPVDHDRFVKEHA